MKLFVWDYHGVLETGNELAAYAVTNLILKQYNYKERLNKKDALMLYGRKWYEYFEHILPYEDHDRHLELQQAGFDFTSNKSEFIASFVKPNPYSRKVLKEISKNHKKILISNTNPESLTIYLEMAKISDLFPTDEVFAANAHYKNSKDSKKEILKDFLKEQEFEELIIIGDSPSDMDLKEVAGGKTYLYCHPGMKHRDCEADFRITDLRDLLAEV